MSEPRSGILSGRQWTFITPRGSAFAKPEPELKRTPGAYEVRKCLLAYGDRGLSLLLKFASTAVIRAADLPAGLSVLMPPSRQSKPRTNTLGASLSQDDREGLAQSGTAPKSASSIQLTHVMLGTSVPERQDPCIPSRWLRAHEELETGSHSSD